MNVEGEKDHLKIFGGFRRLNTLLRSIKDKALHAQVKITELSVFPAPLGRCISHGQISSGWRQMPRVPVFLAIGVKPMGGVFVIGRVRDNAGSYRVGVAVEHGLQHVEFILDFSRFRAVIGDFTKAMVPAIVSESKTGVSVSHPITEGFDRAFEAILLLRKEAANLVCMISH